MKKKLFWLSVLITSLFLVVSCGKEKKEANQVSSVKEKTKVVIFVGFGTGTNPDQIAKQEAVQEAYNSTHDNIEIEFLIVPHDEANDRYLAMLSGGNAPQLVGPNGIAGLAQQHGSWSDISQFIEDDNFDMSDFYPESINLFSDSDKLLGLPIGVFPSMIFYNKDIFDSAGIDYPTHDYSDRSWNYEKLREIAIELTMDKNGNNPTSPQFDQKNMQHWGYDDSWIAARGYLAKWGAEFVGRPTTPDYKTATTNNEEWVYGLQWLSDGIWKDRFIPDAAGQSTYYGAGADPFGGGMVAMFESHTWFFAEGLGSLSFEHDIAPIPFNQKGERIARIHANIFAIPEAAKNKKEAWEVMKWLTAPEQAVEMALIYGCIPARVSLSDDFQTVLEKEYPGLDYSVMYEGIQYLDDPHHESWVPEWSRVEEIMGNSASLVYSGEEKDARIILDTANKEIQDLLDNYWESH
ncbi:extracellular solute-binding protein [Oceanispirochaeta crateris]|uniref:sn-glycerol-3-phosphate-binding periplasmic protein UgpB n=1 Tax=Oceanispirochaeta crateris TaxID=2518645 RepID=A0A5C1QKB8_9SPIO|nr:extracellular solute-binding protein [Oceanispirochaeta crateris]QEN08041.1 extracellular solute-binding protein [Oceanispirochaeta crateris]